MTTAALRDNLKKLAIPGVGHYFDHLWALAGRLHEEYELIVKDTPADDVVDAVNGAFEDLQAPVLLQEIAADMRHLADMESNVVPIPEVEQALVGHEDARAWAGLFGADNIKHLLTTPPATPLPLGHFELRVFLHAARRMGLGRPVGSPYVAGLDPAERLADIGHSCRLIVLDASIKRFCVDTKNTAFNTELVQSGLYEARRGLEAVHTRRVKREALLLQHKWDSHVQKVQTRHTAQLAARRLDQERTQGAPSAAAGAKAERVARLVDILEPHASLLDQGPLVRAALSRPTAEIDALTRCLAEYGSSMRAALQSVPETPRALVVPSFQELATAAREDSMSTPWADDALVYGGQRGIVLDFEHGPLPRNVWEAQTLAYTDGVCEWIGQLIRQAKGRIEEVARLQASIYEKQALGRSVVGEESALDSALSTQQATIDLVANWDSTWNASATDIPEARRRLGMVRSNQRRVTTLVDIAHKLRLYSVLRLDWQRAECELSIATGYLNLERARESNDKYVQVELQKSVQDDEEKLHALLVGNHVQFTTAAAVDQHVANLQQQQTPATSLSTLRANVAECERTTARAWRDIKLLLTGDKAVTLCGQVQEAMLETFAGRIVHESEEAGEQTAMDLEEEATETPAATPTGAACALDDPLDFAVLEALSKATPLIPAPPVAATAACADQRPCCDEVAMAAEPPVAPPVVPPTAAPPVYEHVTLCLPTAAAAERALRVRLHSLIRVREASGSTTR